MIFLLAGHSKYDSGAVGVDKRQENNETMRLRDLVAAELTARKISFVTDSDSDSLSSVLKKIKTGSGSVVLDIHYNAGPASATGIEVIVGDDASAADKLFAADVLEAATSTLKLRSRGVKKESDPPRKRLGVMRENGRVCLIEVCFITSRSDMSALDANIGELAQRLADVLIKHENLTT